MNITKFLTRSGTVAKHNDNNPKNTWLNQYEIGGGIK
jgi:hypothetical protein